MRILLHILHYKLLSYFKSTFDMRAVSAVRGIASLFIFGGFAYMSYTFAFATTRFMLEHTRTGLYLYHTFLSMILFVFFIAVNLGNIIVLYSTIFRSPEVGFLLTKPVSFISIFTLKFFDNFFYSSTTLFLVAFMTLLGYGTYFGFPWYYFVNIMVFILLPFMFLSACLAVLILMAIMKLAGKIDFRKVITSLFIIYLFITYIFFSISNPIAEVEKINHYYPNIDLYISKTTPAFLEYLPNQWVAEFLYNVARGAVQEALTYAGILLAVTAIAFTMCLIVANRFYYKSWLISLQVRSGAQVSYDSKRKHIFDFRSRSFFPPQIEVLIKKELLIFFRDTSQWLHLVVMIILVGLFSVSISNLNLRLRVLDVQLLTYLIIFAFGGFMIGSLALRFVFPMIGMEGQAFWVLRTSPIKDYKILLVKFILGFLLVLIIAEYIAVSSNIPFVKMTEMRPLLLWFGIFSAFWISLTTVSLNLGLGGYFANYLERNPIRAASSQGATLTFLVTIVYLIILVVVVFLPISAYFATLFKYKYFQTNVIILPGTLFAIISYLLSAFGLMTGLRSIRRDF